jgi:hypothetical protein
MEIKRLFGWSWPSLVALALAWAMPPVAGARIPPTAESQTLLHKRPAGSYTVDVRGFTVAGEATLVIEVDAAGDAPEDESTVDVALVPRAEPAAAGAKATEQRATAAGGGRFVLAPAPLTTPGSWDITVRVSGSAGEGTTTFGTSVYPRRPPVPAVVRLSQPFVPIGVMAVVALVAHLRRAGWLRAIELGPAAERHAG